MAPFIDSESRRAVERGEFKQYGDRCFVYYREMLRTWRANSCWTTAHELYRDMVMAPSRNGPKRSIDDRAALELAWQVFFACHIMPYEHCKRTLNGEIDF